MAVTLLFLHVTSMPAAFRHDVGQEMFVIVTSLSN